MTTTRKNLKRFTDLSDLNIYYTGTKSILPFLENVRKRKTECFIMFCFDWKLQLISMLNTTSESYYGKAYYDLDNFKDYYDNISFCICVHNHPNGVASPSKQDTVSLKYQKNYFSDLDISLIDNVIVTETDYFSMAEQKMFKLNCIDDAYNSYFGNFYKKIAYEIKTVCDKNNSKITKEFLKFASKTIPGVNNKSFKNFLKEISPYLDSKYIAV